MRICSFDIKNIYTNVPKIDTINIICNTLGSNPEINMNIQKEILNILQIMMEQNCFKLEQQHSKQTDGLGMVAPTSSILFEIYIPHMEQNKYTQS
jgi:hypothetical protein